MATELKEAMVKTMVGVALLLPKADESKYGVAAKMGMVEDTQEWLMFKAKTINGMSDEEIIKGGFAEEWTKYCFSVLEKIEK
jgi:hypothetical protein